ncbi:MAG: glycoside hydrolase family 97 catalytic domain-containing protein [Polyangiales bacterium]
MPSLRSFSGKFLLVAVLATACGTDPSSVETTTVSLESPCETAEVTVRNDRQGRLTYSVLDRGTVVVEPSPLGLVTTTHDLSRGVTMFAGRVRSVQERYVMGVGKRSTREIDANERVVPLEDANGARAELILRAHCDGVAFRYHLLGSGDVTVAEEQTGFAIPGQGRALVRPYDDGRDIVFIFTAGSYEQSPTLVPIGEATETTGFAFPALFEVGGARHVMVTESDLDASYCGTRLHETPEGSLYRIRFPDPREGRGVGVVQPTASLPLQTPWRVVLVGDLQTIVESTLVDDLARPPSSVDFGWIRPGRAAWSWFSQETGTPLLQSEYIDFAEEHGWDYVLIDANWDRWEDPERAIRALVAEADAGNVRLLLWYNSGGEHAPVQGETPVDKMLDPVVRRAEMERIAEWGVAGIKVDFFASDKQDRIAQYLGILEDAFDYELLVNFHGSTVPRGWQRTYPHLMTHEAVNGAELYKDSINVLGDRAPDATVNLHHVLLRNVVGSMDYTPVTFEAALRVKALPFVHSLALAVLFESGLQHFADRADADPTVGYRAVFSAYPFVADLLSSVPVAWDDTRLVSADIDSHVILARRSGADWYVAGIHTGDARREYEFALEFLDAGRHGLTRIDQGAAPDTLEETKEVVDAGESVRVTLEPRGGFVMRFRPTP